MGSKSKRRDPLCDVCGGFGHVRVYRVVDLKLCAVCASLEAEFQWSTLDRKAASAWAAKDYEQYFRLGRICEWLRIPPEV